MDRKNKDKKLIIIDKLFPTILNFFTDYEISLVLFEINGLFRKKIKLLRNLDPKTVKEVKQLFK